MMTPRKTARILSLLEEAVRVGSQEDVPALLAALEAADPDSKKILEKFPNLSDRVTDLFEVWIGAHQRTDEFHKLVFDIQEALDPEKFQTLRKIETATKALKAAHPLRPVLLKRPAPQREHNLLKAVQDDDE